MTTLQLTNWNFQIQSNSVAHRTSDFLSNKLITRRGQPWTMSLTFNRPLQSQESLSFTAQTGPAPSTSLNTKVIMPVSTSGSSSSWSAVRGSSSSNSMNININVPANAVIGNYLMTVGITSAGRTTSRSLGEFIVLFNPWASGDEVFMSNNTLRNEYVLNQTGVIFYGSANYRGSRVWDYGQFEDNILDITLTLLNSSPDYRRDPGNDVASRNNPIYVGRVLSAMINSNDDGGVVVGNWGGDYTGGVSPTQWSSSVSVLRSWRSSGPVKYGQCWVYAGVLCTVLRCLGIPSRVITNYESAHDTNGNLNVDRYYNIRGESIGSNDSVWNFHAWVEGWFVRKDIGTQFNGWQILDATPQEPSGGVYRLGPTSQKAIREGDIDLDYDGPFLFAEMNADKTDWVMFDDGSKQKVYSDTNAIGKFTSTKAVGSLQREDVTHQYKYAEGTAKEREVFEKAESKIRRPAGRFALAAFSKEAAADAAPAVKPDISGTFKQSGEQQVGQDFTVTLSLKNDATEKICVTVNITATAIVYTGATVKEIRQESQSVSLGPNEEKNIPITITYAQYKNAITADNMIQFVAVCEDGKGGKLLVDTVKVLKNPPLLLTISGQTVINKPFTVDIIFSNPVAEDVEDSQLTVEGSGFLKAALVIKVPLLKPRQRSITQFELTPYRKGKLCLLVDFSSNMFSGVKAYQEINVASA